MSFLSIFRTMSLLIGAACILGASVGCSRQEPCLDAGERWNAETQTCEMSTETPVSSRTDPAPRVDRDSTATHAYEIVYPDSSRIPTALWTHVRGWVEAQKSDFLAVFDESEPLPE